MKAKFTSILFSVIILIFFSFGKANAQFPINTFWSPAAPDSLPPPAYLQSVLDSTHNLNIFRVSDTTAFGVPSGAGSLQHQYSKIQSWNADMSKLSIGYTHILNANDYSIFNVVTYPGGYFTDGRWSNVNPNIRYFCWNDNFLRINVVTEQIDTLCNFPGYGDVNIGPWEGNISADDKYVLITNNVVINGYAGGTKASLYDIELDTVLATKEFAVDTMFDWASITPWGDYIVISNDKTGNTELYDLNFNFLRNLTIGQEHADFAIDSYGNEVFVQVIPVSMTRLDNGQSTDLIPTGSMCGWSNENPSIAGHISGRNFNLPGWALVSTPIAVCGNGNGYYYATEIFAVKLDGSGTIRHYGHSHSAYLSYDSSSKASFSPDGTKVIFNSDWDFYGNGGVVFAYVAECNNLATAIEETKVSDINIYPNPANDEVFISSSINSSFIIIDILGKTIIKGILKSGKNLISLPELNSGMYFIKLQNGISKKLIIE